MYSPTIRRHKTTSRLPTHFRVPFRSLYSNRLMARINQLDSHLHTAHEERIEVAAMESKSDAYAELVQTLREKVAAEKLSTLRMLEVKLVRCH